MKNAILAGLAIVALGAGSAVLTTLALTRTAPPPEILFEKASPREIPAPSSIDLEALRAIEDRQSELARTQRRILDRLNALATRIEETERVASSAGASDRAAGETSSFATGEPDLESRGAGETDGGEGAGPPPALKKAVALALEDIREAEKLDGMERYQENRAKRLERDVAAIGEWLELDPSQQDAMQRLLEEQYAREAEQLRLRREGVDPQVLEERRRADAERFRRDAEAFLYPDQLADFWPKFEPRGGK